MLTSNGGCHDEQNLPHDGHTRLHVASDEVGTHDLAYIHRASSGHSHGNAHYVCHHLHDVV